MILKKLHDHKIIVPLILIIFLLFLSACSSTDTIEVTPIEESPIVHPQLPNGVQMRDIDWIVLNKERLEQLLLEIDESGRTDISLFVLDSRGYENLSVNLQELRRYILEQKEIISYYRRNVPGLEDELILNLDTNEENEDN